MAVKVSGDFAGVILLLIITWSGCLSSTARAAAPTLKLKLCVVANIEIATLDGTSVPLPVIASSVAAAVAAVEHVNRRNFTLVSDGAALLGNREVSVELLAVNLPSTTDAFLAPLAVKTCAENGAHYILGLPTAAFAEAGSLMTQYYGTALSSVMVVSPRLSDEDTFPLFHRLSQTTVDRIRPVVRFIQQMGWRQVAIAYSADVGGEATRNMLQEELTTFGIQFAAFAFPDANDLVSYVTQLGAIASSGFKVVLNYLRIDNLGVLFDAIHEAENQEVVSILTWVQPSPPMDVLASLAYPYYKWLFPNMETSMDGFLAFQREYEYTELQSAYMNVDLDPTFNSTIHADGSPVKLLPATYSFARQAIESEALVRMYDSVWAAVGALVRADQRLADEKPDPGRVFGSVSDQDRKALSLQAHTVIKNGLVSFTGLTGRVRFRSNGDLDSDPDAVLALVNYVLQSTNGTSKSPERGASLQKRCVGHFRNDEWGLHIGESDGTHWAIHWPDGGIYPHVPVDGSMPSERDFDASVITFVSVTVSGVVVIVLLIFLMAVINHNRRLRKRVFSMQEAAYTVELDMDTPAAKIIRFFRSYQHAGTHFWSRRPSVSEAAALEALVIHQMGHLSAPDVKGQLASKSRSYNEGFYDHVITEYTSRRDELDEEVTWAGPSPGVSTRMRRSTVQDVESDSEDIHTAWPLILPEIVCLAGTDFLLDAITAGSPLLTSSAPLAAIVKATVENLELLPSPSQEMVELVKFISVVEEGYPRSGYHCLLHAADVTNHFASLLHIAGVSGALSTTAHRRTMLAGIFAAAIHDYKHEQVNNAFLVEEGSRLAMEFNDHAVLEMYSLRSAFQLLTSRPGLDFTSKWGAAARRIFRRTVIDMVLATDMAQHFALLGQFCTQIGQNKELMGKSGAEKWAAMDSEARTLTLKVAIKVADLGHCYTRLEQHLEWGKRLQEEFFAQGDREKAAGREASPLMDRNAAGPADPANTVGFFRVIAMPLISAWVDVFPECEAILHQARRNFTNCQERIAQRVAATCVLDSPPMV